MTHREADLRGSNDGLNPQEDRKLSSEINIELTAPHGGKLVNLVPDPQRIAERKAEAGHLPSLQISDRCLCDLELIASGAFSPLDRFMGSADYERVLGEMRLSGGDIFPIPVTLPVTPEAAAEIGERVVLRDSRNNPVAMMDVEEVYPWDRTEFARVVAGTTDVRHTLVSELDRWGPLNVSGAIEMVEMPQRNDFRDLRQTPAEVRAFLRAKGRRNVVAFQTRNPLHRIHEELTKRAMAAVGGTLLLHPVVGMTMRGDVDHYTRVRTYKALLSNYYEPDRVHLALIPLAMRMAGPREALWHAVIRKNYGASHFIVGRDHASPGNDSQGKPFYEPYAARELLETHAEEIGVRPIPFKELVFLEEEGRYVERDDVPAEGHILAISGTRVRDEWLANGKPLPEWFTRPEVAEVLAESYPPRHKQGFCVWFTGLSGSGKSTTAEVLVSLLQEKGRHVTVLDGDVVRTHLSKGLGFSKEDRDTNIRRIGFVAAEIVRHGGVVLCAAVSPYRTTRNDVRSMQGPGQFIEVYVDTPIEECERRDTKGMYAKARRGEIRDFTGIDDPYEPPVHPEITIQTVGVTPEENARIIVDGLIERGFLRAHANGDSLGNGHGVPEISREAAPAAPAV